MLSYPGHARKRPRLVSPDRGSKTKSGGVSPTASFGYFFSNDQRSSCNTLCCDWLASDSADTAID
jgi:hypothetical protein